MAASASLLLAEATFPGDVPEDSVGQLASAYQAGEYAAAAKLRHLVLTHLWPGAHPDVALAAARRSFDGPESVAVPGLAIDVR